ncbi:MAG: polysaccharide biosynthesis tyrosine autokinase [Prevotellaceae bacterium]|nr:polysaccharide biosynthesis tyrosine autokinase [Prevotellaceae bacterium]
MCRAHWVWFVLSVGAALVIAVARISTTPPTYMQQASILLSNVSQNSSSSSSGINMPGVMFQFDTGINDEMIAIGSPLIMEEVVRMLRLNVEYTVSHWSYDRVLYGQTSPVTVSFIDSAPEDGGSGFLLRLDENRTIELTEFDGSSVGEATDESVTGTLSDTLRTPVGRVVVVATPYYASAFHPEIRVSRSSVSAVAGGYVARLGIELNSDKSSIINISATDVSPQRAKDVVNAIIAAYSDNWAKNRNQVNLTTAAFINERLAVIERELGHVDEDISSFKRKNLIPDVQATSSLYLSQSQQTSSRILALNTQLSMVRYIRIYVDGRMGKHNLLPINSGIENSSIDQQIGEYNRLQLQYNTMVANSGESHPLVRELDRSLETIRQTILETIDNTEHRLITQIGDLEQSEARTTARIASNPEQAKYLLSVERQQKVKESLFLFLLQKREEAELSQAFTASNVRIIKSTSGSYAPIAPLKRNSLLMALAVGLLIPIVILYVKEVMNTKVRSKRDIEWLSLPYLGEIPLTESKAKRSHTIRRRRRHRHVEVIVKDKSTDLINESFRMVRTHFEFMSTTKEKKNNVVMTTSFHPGSGKSFMTVNLAMSFVIKGKRVLVVDLDLRKASVSALVDSPSQGVSLYLNGTLADYRASIVYGKLHPNLDVLPVGVIPPNPTELLTEHALGELLREVGADYDYVFIDCPPDGFVADASIISNHVDMTLFVIRAGLFERAQLSEVEKLYSGHKYPNMAVVLNAVDVRHGYYGYYYGRYGKYGYYSYRHVSR